MKKILLNAFLVGALGALVAPLSACPPPDADADGVADAEDKCPNEAGDKANNGCKPDGDGDGVPDADDKCPAEKGDKANNGCAPKPAIPAYEPTGDDADMKKAAAAGIDETNAAAKAAELDKALDDQIKALEDAKAKEPAKKAK